jgi:predicted metal-dependent hydrolase
MASRTITVRIPDLDFDRPIDRYYLGGNPIKTHLFNALNLLFPDGERFFVKSVHDHLKLVQDPALREDIRAFAGQEGQHANQHERFFAILAQQGYRVDKVLKPFHELAVWSRRVPRALRLSITAGAEHYTASMAALVLEHDMVADCDPTLRNLITWHALEEIEHKHVAYDVLAAVYPRNYPLRILGFVLATLLIIGLTAAGVRLFLAQDRRARRTTGAELGAAREALRHGKDRRFQRDMRRALATYLRPGFHPNQQDDRPLLARFVPEIALARE